MKKTAYVVFMTITCLMLATVILRNSPLYSLVGGGGFYGPSISPLFILTLLIVYVLTIIFVPMSVNFVVKKEEYPALILVLAVYVAIIYIPTIPFRIVKAKKNADFNNYELGIKNKNEEYCLKIKNGDFKKIGCLGEVAKMKADIKICDLELNESVREECYLTAFNPNITPKGDGLVLTEAFCNTNFKSEKNKKTCLDFIEPRFLQAMLKLSYHSTPTTKPGMGGKGVTLEIEDRLIHLRRDYPADKIIEKKFDMSEAKKAKLVAFILTGDFFSLSKIKENSNCYDGGVETLTVEINKRKNTVYNYCDQGNIESVRKIKEEIMRLLGTELGVSSF